MLKPTKQLASTITLPLCLIATIVLLPLAVAEENAPKKELSPKITISKETTFVTDHITKNGYVDYRAALNAHYGQGVTLENNALIPLLKAGGSSLERWPQSDALYKQLGIKVLPEKGDYFADIDVYLQEVGKQFNPPVDWSELYKKIGPKWRRAMDSPWQAKDAPLLAEWLRRNEKQLDAGVEGVQRTRYFHPWVDDSDLAFAQLSPCIHSHRAVARALSTRAMLRMGVDDLEGAWSDIVATHRLGRLICQGPSLIEGIVGMAIDDIAKRDAWVLAQQDKLTAEQALRFQKELSALPTVNVLAAAMQHSHRLMFLDTVQNLAKRLDGDFDNLVAVRDWATRLGVADWIVANRVALKKIATLSKFRWDTVMRRGNSRFDQLAAAFGEPDYEKRRRLLAKIDADLDKSAAVAHRLPEIAKTFPMGIKQPDEWVANHLTNGLIRLLVGRLDGYVMNLETRSHNYAEATTLAFALAAYRADHDSYPAKLDDLAPKYLTQLPTDPLGNPVIYEATASSYSFTIEDPAERFDVIVATPND